MAYKPTDANYRTWVQAIRSYTTGFEAGDGYDARQVSGWSPYRKRQVREYFELIKGLSAKSTYIYRPRTKKNLKAIKEATGTTDFPRLKVGIIQVPTQYDIKSDKPVPTKPKITISKKGAVAIKSGGVKKSIITIEDMGLSKYDVISNPELFIDEFINEYGDDFKQFTIMAGEHEAGTGQGVPAFYNAENLPKKFMYLLEKYGSDQDGCSRLDPNSHYIGNWFRGFIGYNFDNMRNFADYTQAQYDYRTKQDRVIDQIKKEKSKISDWRSDIRKTKRNRKITQKEKEKRIANFNKKIDNAESTVKDLVLLRFKH